MLHGDVLLQQLLVTAVLEDVMCRGVNCCFGCRTCKPRATIKQGPAWHDCFTNNNTLLKSRLLLLTWLGCRLPDHTGLVGRESRTAALLVCGVGPAAVHAAGCAAALLPCRLHDI